MTTYCADRDCGRPVTAATLCTDHTAELANLIEQTDWMIEQLRVALTRQHRFGASRAGSSGETPVAFNVAASDAALQYVATILLWQGRVADHLGIPVRYTEPIAAATWLWVALPRTKAFADAGKMLNDIESAHSAALRIVNKPADRWFAGICSAIRPDDSECPRDLYAETDTGVIVCPLCGTKHEIAARRATLLASALDHLATATEIARAVVVWSDYTRGENRLVKRIGTWEKRGRIQPRGLVTVSGRQRPIYRLGDVVDLLAADAPESSPRAS